MPTKSTGVAGKSEQEPEPEQPPTTTPEPEEPEPPISAEEVMLYIAPGFQTASFRELLTGAGIVTGVGERFNEVASHAAGLQTQIDLLKSDLQRQIDELKEHHPAKPEPEPSEPETQRKK